MHLVRLRPGPARAGAAGGIASDPAITDAAVAVLSGQTDVLGFLALSIADEAIVTEVLDRAAQLESVRRAAERDDLARRLAYAFARLFR